MTEATTSPVDPSERSTTLDTVRGLAVLGILVMNIVFFALPSTIADYPEPFGGMSGADRIAWYVQSSLFDGRMRGLFSLLFGAGLWMQWQSAERHGHGAQFGDLWSRRCVWLAAFGMIHGYVLQWPGDILFTYGICGLFLFPFRKLRPAAQIGFAVVVMLVATAIGTAGAYDLIEDSTRVQAARAAEASGAELDENQQAALERFRGRQEATSVDALEAESAAMRSANWTKSFGKTATATAEIESRVLYQHLFWDAFSFMLLGLAFGRIGFFMGRCKTWIYVLCLLVGYGAAVPWSLHLGMTWGADDFSMDALEPILPFNATFHVTRLAVGLAHASLIILLVRAEAIRRLLWPLSAVGRLAFSSYILQTLLCTVAFYGWGLAWFGTLQRAELMLFTLCVWAILLVVSPLWLRMFRYGPLEWLWRTVVHGRRPRQAA